MGLIGRMEEAIPQRGVAGRGRYSPSFHEFKELIAEKMGRKPGGCQLSETLGDVSGLGSAPGEGILSPALR